MLAEKVEEGKEAEEYCQQRYVYCRGGHGRLKDSSLEQEVSGMLLSVKGRHIVSNSNF